MPLYKFLTDRALFIPSLHALVIADLHLGIEYGLRKSGVTIPSQTENLLHRLEKLIKQTWAKKLVILGDIKDEYRGLSWQEMREAPNFFAELAKKVELHLVKGNHDGIIEKILPASKRIKIYEPTGFRSGNFAFTHGHAWISEEMLKAKFLLMGNVHPAVEFFSGGDSRRRSAAPPVYRARLVEHIWLRCPINKKVFEKKFGKKINLETAIILPAFNLLAGGGVVNRKNFEIYKPFKKAFVWKSAEIFLLDGICLGNLKNLRN